MAHSTYSFGDRVSVVWDDAVFGATVINVHLSNAVDVVYTKTGSVGVSLTAAEHILQLMGEDGKIKEKPLVVQNVKVRVYLNRSELQGRCSVCLHECFLRNVYLSALIQHAILGVCCTLMQV